MEEENKLTINDVQIGIQTGTLQMSRSHLAVVAEHYCWSPSPFESIDVFFNYYYKGVALWTKLAQPNWTDIIVDVILDPPPERTQCYEDGWDGFLAEYLSEVVGRFPEYGFSSIMPVLEEAKNRHPALLAALGFTKNEEAFNWVIELSRHTEALSPEQGDALAGSIGVLVDEFPQRVTEALEIVTGIYNKFHHLLDWIESTDMTESFNKLTALCAGNNETPQVEEANSAFTPDEPTEEQ